ncbi:MAG: aldo/keto reductase [Clostridia bacterium]|nr:aldo/keto reductase [Clostridia bacterium]
MKKIDLKNTDLKVSSIALGTDSYGSIVDEKLSYEMLDFYVDKGGNLPDTAECYAHWAPNGTHASEKLLGKWMKERKNRSEIVISTKGGFYKVGERPRLEEKDIFDDLEGSLKRLNTDYIDIYWLHRDAPKMPVEDIMNTLTKAIKQGKVRYIGVSNWSCKRLDEANRYLKSIGEKELIASQIQYSPAKPNVEKNEPDLILMNDEEYEYFKNHNLTVFAFAAQAKGFFSKYEKGGKEALSPKAFDRYYNERTIEIFEKLKAASEKYNCTIGNAVIASLVNNRDFDTIPIIGCKNIAQLDDSLKGADINLTDEDMNFIFG